MNVVARVLDGPVSPLAIHFGAGVDEPPVELVFMEVPGRQDDDPMRWVRVELDMVVDDPDARYEWYDLADDKPYAELDTNALWPYTWREGFVTNVLPRRQAGADEDLPTRLAKLREHIAEHNPLEGYLGDELQETMTVRCDRCGLVHKLNFDKFGIDWPDQLAGWGKGPEGDLCPDCASS